MHPSPQATHFCPHKPKQRGIVLFFALIALLVLSLAAAALVRSVDTSTLIAGNLAFRQSATNSADLGVEAAMTWLAATQAANATKNVLTDSTHAFNNDAAGQGYYSSVQDDKGGSPGNADFIDLFSNATWVAAKSVLVGADPDPTTGNTTRYIIQRLCRVKDKEIATAGCLFSGAILDINGQHVKLPQDICNGPGCPVAGQTPIIRVTSRVTGPKNTVSYVQAFVY